MGVFENIFRLKSVKDRSANEIKDETGAFSVGGHVHNHSEELKIGENKTEDVYSFGIRNNYPDKLISLYDTSPTNQAVINRTALMIAGGDTELDVKDEKDVFNIIHALSLQKHPNSKQNIEQIINQVSFDLKLHGRYAIECIWNEAHDKVVQLKRVDVEGVRVGLMNDGEVKSLYYSEDWKDRKEQRIRYQPFSKYGKDARQLIYVQLIRSGHPVYGLPDYYASLKWIELESEIGSHYLDSAKNGFSPKMSVVFPAKPDSEEVEDKIMKRLNDRYTGALGNKIIGVFSPRPELKPEFNPINVENIDKQYQVIDEQTQNKILTGHGVVSPMLFGIKTPGQLGGASELETAFSIYQSSVVAPYQNMIQRSLNEIFEASGNPNRIKLTEFEFLVQPNIEIEEDGGTSNKVSEAINSMSPLVATKVLDSMTQNEIRALGGLPETEGGELTKSQQAQEQNKIQGQ